MATKIPIVVGSVSLLEQLQAGDTLAGTNDPSIVSQTMQSATSAGQVLYQNGTPDTLDLAQANHGAQARAVALATADTAASVSVGCKIFGVLTLTTAEWDTVTGGSGGLAAQTVYYLDPTTPGQLTTATPSTPGQFVVIVGIALSPTDLLVRIGEPVGL
jgi:hypothetical protein